MYARAAASDYDDWATRFGNEGWSSEDLIPLLKKVYLLISSDISILIQHRIQKTENYQLPASANTRNTHGFDGPLKVSHGLLTSIGEDFLRVVASYDKTRVALEDPVSNMSAGQPQRSY